VSARRRILVVAATVLVLVGLAGSTAAYGYDRKTSRTYLPGTRIAGVDVGGMSLSDAVFHLRMAVEDPLHLPLRVHASGLDRLTTPWDLGLRVDVRRSAGAALEQGRRGSLVRRVWRRLFGDGSSFALEPALDRERLRVVLRQAADRVFVPSVDAQMSFSSGWVQISPGHSGRELDTDGAERELARAAAKGASEVSIPVREVRPAVPSSDFDSVVLVRLGENKLYLYENGVVTRTYAVASGSPEFPTPIGRFHIAAKRKNPTWVNPGSAWSKKMPGSIPPGPDNPLGSRAMDLNVSGIRIHGTPDAGSIGFSVSHGCVRMTMSDAEDLFGRVSTGTPVVVVAAGPPKLRTKTPTPPADQTLPLPGPTQG
jgi:lipoprotein-anchoring transpeptidase ErfK/SrfK